MEIEKKGTTQKILDLVTTTVAAISSLTLILMTDDLVMDIVTMVIPIVITTVAIYARHWTSSLFCIIGLVVCILIFIFAQKYILFAIMACVFCIIGLFDAHIGSKQRQIVEEAISKENESVRVRIKQNIADVFEKYGFPFDAGLTSQFGGSARVRDLDALQLILNDIIEIDGVHNYSCHVRGKCKRQYTKTTTEKIAKAKIRDDNNVTVGTIDVKGDVQHLVTYDAFVDEKFTGPTALQDCIKYAWKQSLNNGEMNVIVYVWACDARSSSTIIATISAVEFYNGVEVNFD